MSTLDILITELTTDPLGRGYSGMTDDEASDDLNTEYRSRNKASVSGDEAFNAIDSQATWDGLSDAQRANFLAFCARDSIDPFAAANVALMTSIFGGGSQTITNLAALRVETVSRAVELNVTVNPGLVNEARRA